MSEFLLCCILSKFYIKPQPVETFDFFRCCCILSKFYIKPQQLNWEKEVPIVVSYRNSTSNHNDRQNVSTAVTLYLIEILHQTTTVGSLLNRILLLYLIEILHQTTTRPGDPILNRSLYLIEILHQTTTENYKTMHVILLYLIEILHQTTTLSATIQPPRLLYLIEILHQTTTSSRARALSLRCILSKFYIKPQRERLAKQIRRSCILSKFYIKPQLSMGCIFLRLVVSYRNSTSNHNYRGSKRVVIALYLIEILHQTTTIRILIIKLSCCILSKFYIKPQLRLERELASCSCILSKFYIKPQLTLWPLCLLIVVSYRNSTSNHNWKSFIVCSLVLYLIEILHQTTTDRPHLHFCDLLYLIEILHQTTTSGLILIDKVLLTGCLPL